jgi:hypothetical protein
MHLLPGDHHLATQYDDKIVWPMQIKEENAFTKREDEC